MPQLAKELKVTYGDILSLGESNLPTEIFDGDCIMGPMPSPLHQLICANLTALIREHAAKRDMGKVYSSVDVYISEVVVLQPDICFLSHERSSINDGKKFNGVPDLVVEILSPSTEERDRTFKFREYARGGAKEYWMVAPEKKEIEVYQNSSTGFQPVKTFAVGEWMNTPLFPDARLPLTEVFQ